MTRHRVVVVGGSIAALTAVETLRLEGYDGAITMLSDESVPPYTRVPLSKGVLAGKDPAGDVALPTPSADVDLRLRVQARGLDTDRRLVLTDEGAVPYDGLVIATGARARTLADGACAERVLRTCDDARVLRSDIDRARTVLVVGGGFLGMEIASTCRGLGKEVTIVDREPPLLRLLGPELSDVVRRTATATGVDVRVSNGDVSLIGSETVIGARLDSGETLEADVVVTAAGDVPNVDWLWGSGLGVDGGVLVDDWCRALPDVVAAGDVAVQVDADGRRCRTPSWTNAVEQARAAARALLFGEKAAPYRPSHYYWTEQFGLDIKMVGSPFSLGRFTVCEGSLDGLSALVDWEAGGVTRRVVALNHDIRVAHLKRRVPAETPALSA